MLLCTCKSQQYILRYCLCSLCINVIALAPQWQRLVIQAVAEFIAASLPGLAAAQSAGDALEIVKHGVAIRQAAGTEQAAATR